ncbi:unnamed protein product [Adineta steineri]|uniref:Caspase family p20 domain-containing protein n=1 Tax=Adineta steineri TaxID=433720 RepID=A0A815P3E8_9BILA|nr:unnamed protein product [Adineta steineri]CAF3781500.1 unnamed protein product [Adineta steineri]
MASSVIYKNKRALIIGINDYSRDPDRLKYCINDATDLSMALQNIGFNVTLGKNCNLIEFRNFVDTFTDTIERNDLVLFYYAGHGKQHDDHNYLLPLDYDYIHQKSESTYIADHAISIKNFIRTRGANVNQGLSPMSAPSQTLIVFACAPALRNGNIGTNAIWKQDGIIVAGGANQGSGFDQLSYPSGVYVDDDQTVYVTEWNNHRVMQWKYGKKTGLVVAGGNGEGNRMDQLRNPTDVFIDKAKESLIICDRGNRRVVRWPLHGGTSGKTIISDISCNGLAIDNRGFLYVSDTEQNCVKRWCIDGTGGIVVAGGNEKGSSPNQLNDPYYITVDRDYSVYVSDNKNHRVMKWIDGAKEGIIVAGGRGQGNDLMQLSCPLGVVVDQSGAIYVSDEGNTRIIRWFKEATRGSVVVDGNGQGKQANQLNRPNVAL